MSYIVNGKQVKSVGIITEPSSYGTDITPEDMQSGRTAVSKGKIVTGTGRAFEFASYGRTDLYAVFDEQGNEKIGFMTSEPSESNLMFISVMSDGDRLTQEIHVIDVTSGSVCIIGKNEDTLASIKVYHKNGYLCVYIDSVSNLETIVHYFKGKDKMA